MDVKSLVTEEGLERLNRILVFVFSRLDNADFKAESTRESLRVLQGRGGRVGRRVFEGFGHMDCWIGDRAAGAVFKAIEEEVRRMMGGSDAMRCDGWLDHVQTAELSSLSRRSRRHR
jgi:hypothetical protein